MDVIEGLFVGVYDSFRGWAVIWHLLKTCRRNKEKNIDGKSQISADPANKEEESWDVLKKIGMACGLNGAIFSLSIVFFFQFLLPSMQKMLMIIHDDIDWVSTVWSIIYYTSLGIFYITWILPLFVISRAINVFWFQDIADTLYKLRRGRPQVPSIFSRFIADLVVSFLVQLVFIAQSFLLSYIPYVGFVVSFIHMCFLYSLYSFEYKWFNMGFELHKRLTFIEYNWPYFFGFGFPLTLATSIFNSFWLNGSLFSTLFPLFILSANEASPRQNTCERPCKIFQLAVICANYVFNKSNKGRSKNVSATATTSQSTPSSTPRSTPTNAPSSSQQLHRKSKRLSEASNSSYSSRM